MDNEMEIDNFEGASNEFINFCEKLKFSSDRVTYIDLSSLTLNEIECQYFGTILHKFHGIEKINLRYNRNMGIAYLTFLMDYAFHTTVLKV